MLLIRVQVSMSPIFYIIGKEGQLIYFYYEFKSYFKLKNGCVGMVDKFHLGWKGLNTVQVQVLPPISEVDEWVKS